MIDFAARLAPIKTAELVMRIVYILIRYVLLLFHASSKPFLRNLAIITIRIRLGSWDLNL